MLSKDVTTTTKDVYLGQFRFFGIPTDPILRKAWCKELGKPEDWIPKCHEAVCSNHFTSDSFRSAAGNGNLRLSKHALPTRFGTAPFPGIIGDLPDEMEFSVPASFADALVSLPPVPAHNSIQQPVSVFGASQGADNAGASTSNAADAKITVLRIRIKSQKN